ncbi:MAG: Mur ligase domain-containing protein, partial [Bacteroides sp.]
MELKELIKSLSIKQTLGNSVQEITGVNMDSRLIEPGHLFVAVRGTQADGHAYIDKAIEKGATAIVCEELPQTLIAGVVYIQ